MRRNLVVSAPSTCILRPRTLMAQETTESDSDRCICLDPASASVDVGIGKKLKLESYSGDISLEAADALSHKSMFPVARPPS